MEKERATATLLCGISASGKTRYSKQLEAAGAERLSVDESMWARHGESFTQLPGEEQRQLTLAMEDELREKMSELLREGRDVVVDSCLCKRFKREAFETAAKAAGANVRKVYMTAADEVLLQRLSRRKGEEPNDICVSPEQFARFRMNFQKPESDEGYEMVDTTGEKPAKEKKGNK